jgi:hypothetical protein
LLTISTRQTSTSEDLVFEPSATGNVVIVHSACRATDRSVSRSNRVLAAPDVVVENNPPVPASGASCENPYPFPVEVRIVSSGQVERWSEQATGEPWLGFAGGLAAGQSFVLNPGDRVRFDYAQPPSWRWKAIR